MPLTPKRSLMIPTQQSKVIIRKVRVVVERERGEDNDGNDNFTMVLILLISTLSTMPLPPERSLMIPTKQSKVMNRKARMVMERERGEDND